MRSSMEGTRAIKQASSLSQPIKDNLVLPLHALKMLGPLG